MTASRDQFAALPLASGGHRPCDKYVDVENDVTLWQVPHDAREKRDDK
jgi:hypothetical protein